MVVRDPGDFGRMKRGAILVAPATDPSWTPLFTLASGVIVEVGGVLSHASTIAREYGLPALANVKHATKRLRTGERVRLDAVQVWSTDCSTASGASSVGRRQDPSASRENDGLASGADRSTSSGRDSLRPRPCQGAETRVVAGFLSG